MTIVGVIVAGGKASRMGGGDKGLFDLGGRPILAHIKERVAPQVAELALNANGDPSRFADLGLPHVPDGALSGHGPLAGVLAGLDWACRHNPPPAYVLTVPCDTPFLPPRLAADLREALRESGAEIACGASEGRTHPLCALWPVAIADALREDFREEPNLGVGRWLFRHRVVEVVFASEPVDPFFNVNSRDDLAAAEAACRGLDVTAGATRGDRTA